MDETEQYIKMMEKATKIQEEWKPKMDDIIQYKGNIMFIHQQPIAQEVIFHQTELIENWAYDFHDLIELYKQPFVKEECFWLPRQDQLQELIEPKMSTFLKWWRMNVSQLILKWDLIEYFEGAKTPEQLYLMFYMKSRCNEVWNGEDWVVA